MGIETRGTVANHGTTGATLADIQEAERIIREWRDKRERELFNRLFARCIELRDENDRLRADSAMLDKLLRLGIAVELRSGMYAYFKNRAEITEVLGEEPDDER